MEITISVAPKIEGILAQKAAAKGQDIKVYIQGIIKK